jgi:hypothetical protein
MQERVLSDRAFALEYCIGARGRLDLYQRNQPYRDGEELEQDGRDRSMGNTASMIEEKWLERDMRTTLVNSPPLSVVIGITIDGKSRIVGIMEEGSASAFVAFYNGQVHNATFTIWDGNTIRKGKAHELFHTPHHTRLYDEFGPCNDD